MPWPARAKEQSDVGVDASHADTPSYSCSDVPDGNDSAEIELKEVKMHRNPLAKEDSLEAVADERRDRAKKLSSGSGSSAGLGARINKVVQIVRVGSKSFHNEMAATTQIKALAYVCLLSLPLPCSLWAL